MDWLPGTLLANMDDDSRDALLHIGAPRLVRPREILLRQGDSASAHVFLLISGWYKVTVSTENGLDTLLAIRTGGDLVGEMAAIGVRPRLATVTSVNEGLVHHISGHEFRQFMESHPQAVLHIMQAISEKLRWATNRRQDGSTRSARTRVARGLLDLAVAYGEDNGGALVLTAALTQRDLAMLTGTSTASVERVLGALRKDGIVDTSYRRLVVLDVNRLSLLVSGDG